MAEDKIVRKAPTGNMDTDSDVRYVGRGKGRSGDTLDNRNTQIAQDSGGTAGDSVPTLGNKFADSLGSISAQNKKYTVTVDGDASKSHSLKFLSTKRNARMTTGTGVGGSVEFNGTVSSLTASFNASNLASAFSVNVSGNEVTFELTNGYNYYQWYLDSVGTDDVSVVCIQEAISTDLAGPLKDIGSYDLLGDLFVFSTSQDNLPEETTLTVGGVSLGGPLTLVFFNQAHNLTQGQWIQITNSNAPWLNGVFLVQEILSTVDINIVTDSAWGVTHTAPIGGFGNEVITINPVGIGEIGVAQKDNDTESWAYTRLLRSVELNYVSKKAIDITGDKNAERAALYFEDDYNTSGVFYYYGNYSLDGALKTNNVINFYVFEKIAIAMTSLKKKPSVKIDFQEQLQTGGNIPSGNIRYFVLLKDFFGNWTYPSDLSNIVITYSDKTSGIALGDGPESTNTNKSNVLLITDIDVSVYEKIRLGYFININGASSAFLTDESDVLGNSTPLRHDGFCDEESYDVGLLASNFISGYDFAKSTRIIDKRLIRSNLRKKQIDDFSSWAKTFKHRIKEEFIPSSTVDSDAEEFQNPSNGFYKTGYMLNESYRFSVRGRFTDTGNFTPWFWVDDIKIDPFLTNEYNPTDNRRDQTGADILTNFDLTKDIGAPIPSNRGAKIPYVEFFNVDLNFLIDKIPVSSLISSIEFGRAEVVPEVLCTGIATMSVKFQGLRDVFYARDGSNTDPFAEDDPKRAACFPFSTIEKSGNQALKYIIQVPSSDDINNIRYEYPFVYGPPFVQDNALNPLYPDSAASNVIPSYSYPSLNDTFFGDSVLIQNSPANVSSFSPWKSDRSLLSIYSPDIILKKINDISGYSLLDFGEMFLGIDDSNFNGTASNKGGMYSQFSKYFPENLANTFQLYEIDDWKVVNQGQQEFLSDGRKFSKGFGVANRASVDDVMSTIDNSHRNISGPVVFVDNNGLGVDSQGKNIDYGVRYVQFYKELRDKYCSKESTQYYTTNSIYSIKNIENQSGIVDKGVLNVFGGDTLTQLTYLKGRFVSKDALTEAGLESWSEVSFTPPQTPGFGGGMKFYSQNRVNSQMRYDDIDQIVMLGDGTNPISPWLEEANGKPDLNSYDSKFTIDFPSSIFGQPSFESLNKEKKNLPQRIEYSARKIYSQESDAYLDRPPLNIHDLNLTFGEIIHHEDIGGQLFSIQNRKFQIESFNARGVLQSSENSVDILLKSADVFTTDGKTLSSYGTSHKWSCIKGVSDNGKDVLYWFNSENGLMMRFGEDGTRVISSRGMAAYFVNYTKWVKDKHEHAFEQGVRGVWDDRRKEAIWTFTGWRNISQWENSGQVLVQTLQGTVIENSNAPSDSYEEFPRFFRCTVAHTSSSANEPGVGVDWEQYWEQIPYTDFKYYSIFTICFNEQTNGFRCFYDHLPKTYLKWQNTFLSSHPVHRNLLFEHRLGDPTTWYGLPSYLGGAIAPKVEDAYVEMALNELPEQSLRGVAVRYLSENAPDRIDYQTERQKTFDEEAQFTRIDDQWVAPIRNDTTVTGNPTGRGAMLSGDYLRVKFTIFGGTYNRLHSIVIKIRDRFRRSRN